MSDSSAPRQRSGADGRHDFDFLHGSWRIRNRRLATVFENGREWQEFDSTAVVRPILHGLGNTDLITVPDLPGVGPFEGATLRLFDPAADRWRIFWASTRRPGHLDPPLTGRFEGRRGEFHGEDTYAGRPIRVRFLWDHDGGDAARWQQFLSDDDALTWELNWVMRFERVAASPG
jgi:hypothetical protein